jgi:hypothetical protein
MRVGLKILDWYSFPEVLSELHRQSPPRERQSLTVFFTVLSGFCLAASESASLPVTSQRNVHVSRR